MSQNVGTHADIIPAQHPPHPPCCVGDSAQACRRHRDKAARRNGNVPPCHDRRLLRTPCRWSAPLRHFGGGTLLPVAASTTIVPVMCGCKEQKYLYVPGVVNVNENLSSLSSGFDLKLLGDTTVCGISSTLVHVTVVPDFTFTSCGPKVKLSILTATSSAQVGVAAKTSNATTPAMTLLISDFVFLVMSDSPL